MLCRRFYWGITKWAWDLGGGSDANGAKVISVCTYWGTITEHLRIQVITWSDTGPRQPWRVWKLIPVEVQGRSKPSQSSPETRGLGSLPPYNEDTTRQTSTNSQYAESERDDFGTVVTEVTVVATRKRYRVGNA